MSVCVLACGRRYEESVEALREAKYLVENTGQSSDQAKLELILTLTE